MVSLPLGFFYSLVKKPYVHVISSTSFHEAMLFRTEKIPSAPYLQIAHG